MNEYDRVHSLIDECLDGDVVPSNSEQLSGSVYLGCIVAKFQELKDVIRSSKREMPSLQIDNTFSSSNISLQRIYYRDGITNFVFGTKYSDCYKLSVLNGDEDAFYSTVSSFEPFYMKNYSKKNLSTILKYAREIEAFSKYFPGQTICTSTEEKNAYVFNEQLIHYQMKVVFSYDDRGEYQVGLGMVSYADPKNLFDMKWINRESLFYYACNNIDAILQRIKVPTRSIPSHFKPIIDEAFTKCSLPEFDVPREKVLTCKKY